MEETVIKLKGIKKDFIRGKETIEVLKGIDCEFEKGKFYAVKGHSGSGKSTLVNIIGLLENPSSGSYHLNDKDVSKLSEDDLADIRFKSIGFIFQDYYLDANLKAVENVMMPLLIDKNMSKKEAREIAEKLLNELELSHRINHFPKELSGGEQQRVAIARALANNPEIILADEPTGNLDKKNEAKIFEDLKKLSQNGKCVIVVSHSQEVNDYADIIYTIDDGLMV